MSGGLTIDGSDRRIATALLPYCQAISVARLKGEKWSYIAACLASEGITLPKHKERHCLRLAQRTLERCVENGVEIPQQSLPDVHTPSSFRVTSTNTPVAQKVTTTDLFGGQGSVVHQLFQEITSNRSTNYTAQLDLPELTITAKAKEIYPDLQDKISFWRDLYKDGFVPRVAGDIMTDDEAAKGPRASLEYVDKLTYELPYPFEGFEECSTFGYRPNSRMRHLRVDSNEEITAWISMGVFGDFHPTYRSQEMGAYLDRGYKSETKPINAYLDESLKQYVGDNLTLWLALLTGLVIQPVIHAGIIVKKTEQEYINDMSHYIPINEKRN